MVDDPSARHILIYGPPAAGKLTVAEALAEATGFRVLDNHLTIDVSLKLFAFGSPPFRALRDRLRLEIAATAAGAGISVVSTHVWTGIDRGFIDGLAAVVEAGGAKMCFVQLRPAADELERRVVEASRAARQKLQDVDALRHARRSRPLHQDQPRRHGGRQLHDPPRRSRARDPAALPEDVGEVSLELSCRIGVGRFSTDDGRTDRGGRSSLRRLSSRRRVGLGVPHPPCSEARRARNYTMTDVRRSTRQRPPCNTSAGRSNAISTCERLGGPTGSTGDT